MMNKNDKPWEETKQAKEKLRQQIVAHRTGVYLTCPEDCWCWNAQAFILAHDYEMAWVHQMSCGWAVGSEFDAESAHHALTGE